MHGDGEDAAVVVAQADADGQHGEVGVAEVDAERAALADLDREVQTPVLDPEVVQVTERLAGEVADLGVVPLALELADDHDGQHDRVLRESEECLRIAQQHRRVEHVGAQVLIGLRGRVLLED